MDETEQLKAELARLRLQNSQLLRENESLMDHLYTEEVVDGSDGEDSFVDTYGRVSALSDVFEDEELVDDNSLARSQAEDGNIGDASSVGANVYPPQTVLSPNIQGKRSLTGNNAKNRGRASSFNPRSSLSSSLHKRFVRTRSRTASSIYSETPLQIDHQTHGLRIDENALFNTYYQQPLTKHDASVFQVSCVEVNWAEYIQRFNDMRQAMDEMLLSEDGNGDSSNTEQKQQQDKKSMTDKNNTNTTGNTTIANDQASRSTSVADISGGDKRRGSSVVSSTSKIDMAAMKKQMMEETEAKRGKERILEKAFLSGLETWKYCPSVDQLNNQDIMTDPKEHHSVRQGQPSEDSKSVESAHIQQFCFPAGVSVKYVSKSAVEYLVGDTHDQYHIMQFADSNGHQSYACCLTVTKVVRAPSEAVLDALHYAYSKQRPAAIIRKFMRKVVKYIKKRRWENASEGVLTNRFSLQHLSDEKRHGPDDLSESTPQNRSATSRMMAMFGDSSTTNRNSTSSTTGSTYSSYFGMSSSTPAAPAPAPSNDDAPQSTFFGRMKARLGYTDTPVAKPTAEEQRKARAAEAAAAREFFSRQQGKSATVSTPIGDNGNKNKTEDNEGSSRSSKGQVEEAGSSVRIRGPSHDFTVLPEPLDEPSVNRSSVQVTTTVDLLEQQADEEDSNIRDSGNQSPNGATEDSRLSNSTRDDASHHKIEDLLSLDAPLSNLNNSPNNEDDSFTAMGGNAVTKVPPSKRMSLSLRSRAGVPITLSYDGTGKRERNASIEEGSSNKSSTKSTTNTTGIADISYDHDHNNAELLEAISDAVIVDSNDIASNAKNTTVTDDSSDADTNPYTSSDAKVMVKNLGGLETLTTLNESEASHDSVKVTWETLNDSTDQTTSSSTSLGDTEQGADSESRERKGDKEFDVFGDTYLDTLPEQHRNKRVVAEVAYCLISPHPIQSLGFTVLKAIADAERELCNDTKASSRVGNDDVRFGWSATNGSNGVETGGTKTVQTDEAKYGWNAPTSGTNDKNRTDSSISLTSNMTKIINQGDLFSLRYHFIRKVHLQFVYWAHAGGLAEQLAYSFGSVPSVLASKVIPTRKTQLKRFRNLKKGQANYRKSSLSGTERYKSKPNGATTGREATNSTANAAITTIQPTTNSSDSQDTTTEDTVSTKVFKETSKPPSLRRKMSGTSKDGSYNKMAIGDLQHIEIEHSLMHIDMPHYLSASSASGSREGHGREEESASVSTTALSGTFQIDLSKLPSNDELAAVVTFSYLNSSIIFKLINLLLMEKSLVVCGKHPGIVSMVALGIKNLILPFKWEGVFVPLLPHSARELFGAPVPFILGTTIPPREKDVSYSSAILHLQEEESGLIFADDGDEEGDGDDDEDNWQERQGKGKDVAGTQSSENKTTNSKNAAQEARLRAFSATSIDSTCPVALRSNPLLHIMSLHTLKLPSLPETVSWFIRLPDSINADMPHSEGLERKIENTRKFLRHCRARYVFRNKIKPSVKLDMHYVTSISMNEKRAVLDLSKAIYEHNMRFCGDSSDPMAWKRYIKRNSDTGEEEFYPNWFMEPIRRQIEFQEAVVRTQLFVGYIDGARIESENKDFYRIFIRDFINFRLYLAKMKIIREREKAINL